MPDSPELPIEDVQRIVREARENGDALRPVGGGVQSSIGSPCARDARLLSTSALTRLVEYSPDDMVVVAQAGVTFGALQAQLAVSGQWLPIEPALPGRQTLGGIVATRANSLVRAGYGSVRDWLIGIAVVGGDGELVRGGGKVVKNVSGYDLPKLYCGSWGTLGVIVETAFKVAPLPQASATLLAVLPGERNGEAAIEKLLAAGSPTFAYVFNTDAARVLMGDNADEAQYLAMRFDGPPEAVAMLAARAKEALAPVSATVLDLPPALARPLCDALRDFSAGDSELTMRFNVLSSQVGAFARMIEWTAAKGGFRAAVVGEGATGILFARFTPEAGEDARWDGLYALILEKAERVGGSFVVERMPEAWRALGSPVWWPMPVDIEIMRGIKKALDPANLFNPGQFVGGI